VPSVNIQGSAAPGRSSGDAMIAMEKLVAQLPPGVSYEWTGLSQQERESGAQAPMLYGISILVVFLLLAALYESWSIPLSVIMVIPLGIVGALLATTLRGMSNDIYFQVGLLTTMGLAAKNAILIVEFARELEFAGKTPLAAAIEASRLRLRPILMTSLAFVMGVVPLAFATGAGAEMRQAMGIAVFAGMIGVTAFGLFLTPVFYVLLRRIAGNRPLTQHGETPRIEAFAGSAD
jgi:multidrug efflux pump subunit AcrB